MDQNVFGIDHETYDDSNYNNVDNRVVEDKNNELFTKIFVGGLSWQTTEDSLRQYFEKFGELVDITIMMDRVSGQPRGFAFLTFGSVEIVDTIMNISSHVVDLRVIDVKRAVSRENAPPASRSENKKLFVGGLLAEVTETDFGNYFSKFGPIKDLVIMVDRNTNRSRGFGFVTFENESSIEDVLRINNEILGKWVEVKRAQPRDVKRNIGYVNNGYNTNQHQMYVNGGSNSVRKNNRQGRGVIGVFNNNIGGYYEQQQNDFNNMDNQMLQYGYDNGHYNGSHYFHQPYGMMQPMNPAIYYPMIINDQAGHLFHHHDQELIQQDHLELENQEQQFQQQQISDEINNQVQNENQDQTQSNDSLNY